MTTRKLTGRLGSLAKIRATKGDLLPMLNEIILAEAGDDEDRRQDILHVSEMAKSDWCPRASYYRIAGWKTPPEDISISLENVFEEGNTIHEKWQDRMRKTGKLFGLWECIQCHAYQECVSANLGYVCDPDWVDDTNPAGLREDYCSVGYGEPHAHMWEYREVHMSAEDTHLITAHADGAIDDFLVEIKSVGMGTLRNEAPKLLSEHYLPLAGSSKKVYDLDAIWRHLKPLPSHTRQGMLYLWIARQMGLPYTKIVFLYEFKPNQQVKEFTVELSDKLVEPLLLKAKSVKRALDNIDFYGLPDCPADGCKYCEGIEALNADKARKPEHSSHGRGVPASGGEAGGAEDRGGGVGGAAGDGTTSRARGNHRADRPQADGPVREDGALVRLPHLAIGSGAGRRVLLYRGDQPA